MTEASLLPLLVAPLAIGIGWAVGKMPCWKTWQGYVGLLIVVPVALAAGVNPVEVCIDSLALGAGYALAPCRAP